MTWPDGYDAAAGYEIDRIQFADGSEWNQTTIKSNVVRSTDSDDVLRGFATDDVISAGLGDDAIYRADGNDTLSGGDGVDALYGDVGNDHLLGDAGDDHPRWRIWQRCVNGQRRQRHLCICRWWREGLDLQL